MVYSAIEKRIVNTLYSHQRPLTTYQLAEYTGYSYATVRKYLEGLYHKGLLHKLHNKRIGKGIYWWLREE
jgi:response regulator of citrate/malate metabolism